MAQQEPDASSFPNGGIRNTFEARGYSAWDPSSPAFIVDDTLCIPTIFIAYTGESLDYKAPLLKALRAVNKAATDVCRYFNPEVNKVVAYLGWEQEYFLVDEGLYAARPDLLLTGRTLMGHDSAKNQQLEDHYIVIASALPLLLLASGGTSNYLNYLIIFLAIIAMSIFFSLHYLVLYYLFQPYNLQSEVTRSEERRVGKEC